MTRTKFLNNHGDLRHGLRFVWFDLRRNIGLLSIFSALMFLGLPFLVAIGIQTKSLVQEETASFLSSSSQLMPMVYVGYGFLVLLSILAVLLIPALLFKYLDNKREVDLYQSLPISRNALFLSKYVVGLLLIVIPTLFAFLCTILVRFLFQAPGIDLLWLTKSIFSLILMQTASYTFSVLIAVSTGTVFDMILSLLILNGIWPALYFTFQLLGAAFLYGFALRPTLEPALLFSPIPRMVAAFLPSLFGCLWWGGLTIVMFLAALFLYRRRKSESAGQPFAFRLPDILIRYGFSLLCGILFGLLLWAITTNIALLFVGFLIGMVLTYVIIVSIINRGFKRFLPLLKGIPLLIVAFLLIFALYSTGGLGFEKRVPQAEDVSSVSVEIGSSFEASDNRNGQNAFRSADSIEQVVKLQHQITEYYASHKSGVLQNGINGWENTQSDSTISDFTFSYRLSSGEKLTREYSDVPLTEELKSVLLQLSQCSEFRPVVFQLDTLQNSDLSLAEVYLSDSMGKALGLQQDTTAAQNSDLEDTYSYSGWSMSISSPVLLNEFRTALAADLMQSDMALSGSSLFTDSSSANYSEDTSSVSLSYNRYLGLSYTIYPDFTNTLAFLKQHRSLFSPY